MVQTFLLLSLLLHEDADIVVRIVRRLLHPSHFFILHLANDVPLEYEEEVVSHFLNESSVCVIRWGEIHYLTATDLMIVSGVGAWLLAVVPQMEFFIALDGRSYPLWSVTELRQRILLANGTWVRLDWCTSFRDILEEIEDPWGWPRSTNLYFPQCKFMAHSRPPWWFELNPDRIYCSSKPILPEGILDRWSLPYLTAGKSGLAYFRFWIPAAVEGLVSIFGSNLEFTKEHAYPCDPVAMSWNKVLARMVHNTVLTLEDRFHCGVSKKRGLICKETFN